ncbi:MAG TPA: exodeoxyribonuclease III [Burkholderiales bacterium]|nr:exodeoxyribonuclease III [Burkholderiales bacterium]
MKLAAWNVNSLKVRLPHLLDWIAVEKPDVVCLQELKLEDEKFPITEIERAGYQAAWYGQKTYNGVAILAREAPEEVEFGIAGLDDPQRRVISATVAGIRIVSAYVPNGQSLESEKYRYKLDWLGAFTQWLRAQMATHPSLAVLGDYNIAPEDRDVHDPRAWEGQVLVSGPERAAFQALLGLGLQDSFRLFEQPEKSFSWWDYRMNAFKRNLGLRIDHVLLSEPLASRCTSSRILTEVRKLERPSDHAPVIAELS